MGPFTGAPTTALYGVRLTAALEYFAALAAGDVVRANIEHARALEVERIIARRERLALTGSATLKATAGDTSDGGGDSGPREGNAGSAAPGPSPSHSNQERERQRDAAGDRIGDES